MKDRPLDKIIEESIESINGYDDFVEWLEGKI
jgi:hypothetical protein